MWWLANGKLNSTKILHYYFIYLVDIVFGNNGIQSTIEIIQKVDYFHWLTLCGQFRESDNVREVHRSVFEKLRHRSLTVLHRVRNNSSTVSDQLSVYAEAI